MKIRFALAFLLGSTLAVSAQSNLRVVIKNLKSNEGSVYIGVYNQSDLWLTEDGDFTGQEVSISELNASGVFENLPAGRYAVAVYHDENGDDRYNKSWIGLPLEPYGFSNNKQFVVSPPDFEEASVEVQQQDVEIAIVLR